MWTVIGSGGAFFVDPPGKSVMALHRDEMTISAILRIVPVSRVTLNRMEERG
jgi:hypothetical protein